MPYLPKVAMIQLLNQLYLSQEKLETRLKYCKLRDHPDVFFVDIFNSIIEHIFFTMRPQDNWTMNSFLNCYEWSQMIIESQS